MALPGELSLRVLGSYYQNGKGWFHTLSTRLEKNNSLWRYGAQGKWEEVASELEVDLRNTLRFVDRTAVNAIGFETFGAKIDENALSRWTPPDRLEKVSVTRPEGFDPWDRLYTVKDGKLAFVPCLIGSSTIFQRVEEQFVTVVRGEMGTEFVRSDGTSQLIAEGVEFPDGFNDFLFLRHDDKLWAVQFNGERVEVPSNLLGRQGLDGEEREE